MSHEIMHECTQFTLTVEGGLARQGAKQGTREAGSQRTPSDFAELQREEHRKAHGARNDVTPQR